MKNYLLCFSLCVAMCMNAMEYDFKSKELLQDIMQAGQPSCDTCASEIFFDVMRKHHIKLSDVGSDGSVILHEAVQSGADVFIEKCIAAGAHINVKDSEGRTPLFVACGYWDYGQHCLQKNIVKMLIDHEARVNIKDKNGMTALHKAVSHEWTEESIKIVKMLLSAGARTTEKDNNGKTAYDYAADDTIKRALLFAHGDFEELNLQQPPIYALQYDPELLKKAIPLGLNVNAYDSTNGASLLWLFFDNIHYDKLGLMEEVLDLFIQYGVDVNHKTKRGDTILHKTARMERIPESWVKKLIDAGAQVNAKNEDGEAPLHWAAYNWYFNTLIQNFLVAKLLITHGNAEINIQDNCGETPLHYAVSLSSDKGKRKQEQMIFLLLLNGADSKKENNVGQTPYKTACQILGIS